MAREVIFNAENVAKKRHYGCLTYRIRIPEEVWRAVGGRPRYYRRRK